MSVLRNGFRVLFVLWAGSLWAIALFVAPTLFYAQPDRHLAGVLAARLFSIETYLALGVCALVLFTKARGKFLAGFAAAGLLALNEWVLKGLMEQARLHGRALGLGFGPWHGIAALVYVIACLAVVRIVWKDAYG
jgi:hypothetical protein